MIGGPRSIEDNAYFLTNDNYDVRSGPLSVSVSAASTLVHEPVKMTEFWNSAPTPPAPSMKKSAKKNSKSNLQLKNLVTPHTGTFSAQFISSPIESIPPKRPAAPGQDPWSSSYSCYSQNSPTTPPYPFNSASSIYSSSTIGNNVAGRSKRIPAHLPTPISSKQQQHQGTNQLNSHKIEDSYVLDFDDSEWLMMPTVTSDPLTQQEQESQQHVQQQHHCHVQGYHRGHQAYKESSRNSYTNNNNGWGDMFSDDYQQPGNFFSSHPHPSPSSPCSPQFPAKLHH
ncbi:hypothetical protein BGZ83_008656 [Gryganskiella cystojenkinii]|nr:hypothetical protein BGZ83_008656 [Gryganskiella cystojenkinii]